MKERGEIRITIKIRSRMRTNNLFDRRHWFHYLTLVNRNLNLNLLNALLLCRSAVGF